MYNGSMKSPANKAVSIYLTADEKEQLKKIAAELNVSEHAIRHFAIQRLIADWARDWRPKRKKKTVQTLEP